MTSATGVNPGTAFDGELAVSEEIADQTTGRLASASTTARDLVGKVGESTRHAAGKINNAAHNLADNLTEQGRATGDYIRSHPRQSTAVGLGAILAAVGAFFGFRYLFQNKRKKH